MNILPATISAIAATIAAVLAGVNIYLTRRNADVSWAREALVETFTLFLGASFQSKDAIKQVVRIALTDPDSPDVERLRQDARRAEEEMRELQTRLRLLTSGEVIESAQQLRQAVRDYIAFTDDMSQISVTGDKQLRDELWRRRHAFIASAKKAVSV